jgi:hypothetical protein
VPINYGSASTAKGAKGVWPLTSVSVSIRAASGSSV